MALYDQVIDQQRSLYPGSNVLEIAIPPPASRLERYPGEEESGQRMPISPRDLMRLRQQTPWGPEFQPLTPDIPQDVPPMRVVPDASAPPAQMPFGFHPLYNEQNQSLWQMLGLPEKYHPYAHGLAQAANFPANVISAEASVPHQVLSSVLHPLFRLLFTGTPFTEQNAFTRRFPGFSPGLPGRTAMGALADPAASLATFATESEVAPEKLFGGARNTRNMYKGNPKGYSLRGTIPGAIYDRLEDLATGTTRDERAWQGLQERINNAERAAEEDQKLRRSGLPTGPLRPGENLQYAPNRLRYVDPEWNYKDAMRRIEERRRMQQAMQKALDMVGAKRIPVKTPPK